MNLRSTRKYAVPTADAPGRAKRVIDAYFARWQMLLMMTAGVAVVGFVLAIIMLAAAWASPQTNRDITDALAVFLLIMAAYELVIYSLLVLFPTFLYRRYVLQDKIIEIKDPALVAFYYAAYKMLGERHRNEQSILIARQRREHQDIVAIMRRLAAAEPDQYNLYDELKRIRTGEAGQP